MQQSGLCCNKTCIKNEILAEVPKIHNADSGDMVTSHITLYKLRKWRHSVDHETDKRR